MQLLRCATCLGSLLLAGLATAALAQAYPSKPVRWVVPYPAGGGSDVIARTISTPLAASLGQPVVIDNRPGAATIIGADMTARSPPDGYTIATADSATEAIADLVLSVNVGGYALEMGNPRHEHEWRVWETVKLPEGRTLIPGVISHSTNVVEHPRLVAERIVRLARLVGRDRLIAGTDCGFAQGPFVQRVHPSIMWAKLALVEGAQLASRELWGSA